MGHDHHHLVAICSLCKWTENVHGDELDWPNARKDVYMWRSRVLPFVVSALSAISHHWVYIVCHMRAVYHASHGIAHAALC